MLYAQKNAGSDPIEGLSLIHHKINIRLQGLRSHQKGAGHADALRTHGAIEEVAKEPLSGLGDGILGRIGQHLLGALAGPIDTKDVFESDPLKPDGP